ncbi:hypothetical protein Bhyg_16259 [Pseudolycoriella hygida]|uniref:Gustatory receptor n=1 Tax=Pseudolycoriella hygida TaxID=35572 RepID=A0A9Q0MML7_9DIPT|nr:hypothetical protein Bhyg_16259 [Pseudolycoriella hygida]
MIVAVNPTIINLFFFFGICPYKYNDITETIDCCPLRLIYSLVYHIFTSLYIDYAYAIYHSKQMLTQGFSTYEISKIIEDISCVVLHHCCMVNVFLQRKNYARFLNTLNAFERRVETQFGVKSHTKHETFTTTAMITVSIIYFVLTCGFNTYLYGWSTTTVLFFVCLSLKMLSYLLVSMQICYINVVMLNRFHLVFNFAHDTIRKKCSSDLTQKQSFSKSLVKCLRKLEELYAMKSKFSDTFGLQILLIVSNNFFVMTIAFYFSLKPPKQGDAEGFMEFMIVNCPNLVILLWMVVLMEELGQQVNKMKHLAAQVSSTDDEEMASSMSAAIITHMLIIVQFEQWESSQSET